MSPISSFAGALRLTLWLVGLVVALMTGMLSAYLVLSAVYVGSRIVTRLRAGVRSPTAVDSGEGH